MRSKCAGVSVSVVSDICHRGKSRNSKKENAKWYRQQARGREGDETNMNRRLYRGTKSQLVGRDLQPVVSYRTTGDFRFFVTPAVTTNCVCPTLVFHDKSTLHYIKILRIWRSQRFLKIHVVCQNDGRCQHLFLNVCRNIQPKNLPKTWKPV